MGLCQKENLSTSIKDFREHCLKTARKEGRNNVVITKGINQEQIILLKQLLRRVICEVETLNESYFAQATTTGQG